MPLGINQSNYLLHFTMDVLQDKVYYNEKEYPAGYFAASILNAPDDVMSKMLSAGSALLKLTSSIPRAEKEKILPVASFLKDHILAVTEHIWTLPPFCFNDIEQERKIIDLMLEEESLEALDIPDSRGRAFFLSYIQSTIFTPVALQHFIFAGTFFERGYLRRLKKRDETHFVAAAHDCFTNDLFWHEMDQLQMKDVEPFSISPDMRSSYVFARHPKREKEMVFVNRYFFDRVMSFYTFDLFNGLQHGHAPSQCIGCGKYFLTTDGHMPKYCDGIAPQDSRYTCRQYGASMRQKEQNKQHPIYRLFSTRTNTIRKHHERGKISDSLRREAIYIAESYRDKALMDNSYASDGYEQDMEQEHIYAEARKRLP